MTIPVTTRMTAPLPGVYSVSECKGCSYHDSRTEFVVAPVYRSEHMHATVTVNITESKLNKNRWFSSVAATGICL